MSQVHQKKVDLSKQAATAVAGSYNSHELPKEKTADAAAKAVLGSYNSHELKPSELKGIRLPK
jgi:hypothetical protein